MAQTENAYSKHLRQRKIIWIRNFPQTKGNGGFLYALGVIVYVSVKLPASDSTVLIPRPKSGPAYA